MVPNSDAIIRWFAIVGNQYVNSYLSPNKVDMHRLRTDLNYGLRLFLFKWAYERKDAPQGYRIAAVKAISSAWPDLSRIPDEYSKFYHGPKNAAINPCMDPNIANLNIPFILTQVEQGNLAEAFRNIQIKGIAHKIASFFLRDIVSLTRSESKIGSFENYLYCQPIDTWVRLAVNTLALPIQISRKSLLVRSSPYKKFYRFENQEDYGIAISLTDKSLQVGVSPLLVNQGIWYFSSNIVGDAGRIAELLTVADTTLLDIELNLLDDFKL